MRKRVATFNGLSVAWSLVRSSDFEHYFGIIIVAGLVKMEWKK